MKDSLRTVRRRIRGTRKVLKVTAALERMSAARVIQCRAALRAGLPYAAGLLGAATVASRLAALRDEDPGAPASAVSGAGSVLVVLGGNRSLCGGFNGRLLAHARTLEVALRGDGPVSAVILGRALWRRAGAMSVRERVPQPPPGEADAFMGALFDGLRREYERGRLARILAVYGVMAGPFEQQVRAARLLPLDVDDAAALLGPAVGARPGWGEREPDAESVLCEPAPAELRRFAEVEAARALCALAFLHSALAENAARQMAMHRAQENARALIDGLTARYNRLRQEAITTQVIEVAAGLGAHAKG